MRPERFEPDDQTCGGPSRRWHPSRELERSRPAPAFPEPRMRRPAGIDLPPMESEHRGAGKRVMVVVPSLTHRWQHHPDVVGALVPSVERTRPEDVGDGIDRVHEVIGQEQTDQPSPEKPGQRSHPASREEAAEDERNQEAKEDPGQIELIDSRDRAILVEIPGEEHRIRQLVSEGPAHVGVPEPLQSSELARTVEVGGVNVPGTIGVLMMPAVVAHPVGDRPLTRPWSRRCRAARGPRWSLRTNDERTDGGSPR